MMATPAINHLVLMAQRLLWQFRDSANFRSLAQSLGAEINAIEAAFGALEALTVDTEAGAQLDGDGALLGVDRAGRTDTDYAAAIHAQTRINRGLGRIEDVLFGFARTLPGYTFELAEPVAATVRLTVLDALGGADPSPEALVAALKALIGGGVSAQLFYGASDASSRFTLASGDTLETSSVLGLADDGQTTGGHLSEVI